MRIRTRFVWLVSAAVLLSLGAAFAAEADRAGMQQILSAALSQTERDVKLWDWFEQQFAQGATLSEADKELHLRLESRYGDLRGRDGLDNQGGPDAFNYFYMDNVAPDTATYNWIELRGLPEATWIGGLTHFTNIDDGYSRQKLPIGFSFPFYGAVYDCVRVACNGFLQFTTTAGSSSNFCMPSTAVGGPMIAVFWDDLHLLYGGRTDTVAVGYRNFGDCFVIEFDGIGFYTLACRNVQLKFEAILYPSGNIKLQYHTITPPASCVNSQSIGIQQAGAAGSSALNYVCNTTGIQPANGRAILFARAAGVPNPVTNLSAQYVQPNVVLTWTDPTQDTQGNPITIDNVQVWATAVESGTLLATVPAGVQTYTELNPPMGTRRYFVRPFRGPYHGAAVSQSVVVGTPSYWSDFETNNGGWVTPPEDGWSWGTPTNPSAPAPYSGTSYWGTGLLTSYSANACWQLDLDSGLVVTSPTATVEFWYYYDSQLSYDGCNLKVSTDNGAAWSVLTPTQGAYNSAALSTTNTCMGGQPAWSNTTPRTWQYAIFSVGDYLGQSLTFRFEFSSNASTQYTGFFFDDMIMWGVESAVGVPQPCTNLAGDYAASNVVLTWTDPTLDTHGSPLVLDSVQVWLGSAVTGTHLASVIGGTQNFTHVNAPIGIQRYTVRPRHGLFFGVPTSINVTVGNPGYANDFEADNGGWVADPDSGWEWGIPTYVSGPTAFSGTKVWGTVLASTYPDSACFRLTLTPNMIVTTPDAQVEFWRWYYTEQSYDGVNFKVSTDGGLNWMLVQPVGNYPYTASTANVCIPGEPYWAGNSQSWTQITLPLGQFVGQMPVFRFTFGSDPSVHSYPGFYLDDLVIWGMANVSGFPRPPTNFGGSYALGNITLTWTDPTLDILDQPMTVDSIQVWLGQASTGTRLGSVGPGVQTYVHVNAPPGLQTYSIRAYNVGYGSAPVSASVESPTVPPAPANDLVAFRDGNGIRLAWSPTNLANGYLVYRTTEVQQEYTAGELLTPVPITETTFLDTYWPTSTVRRFYQVIAVR